MGIRCPKCQHENPDNTLYCGKCATSLQPKGEIHFSRTRTIQQPPKIMAEGYMLAGKYRILEPIGKGGMGVVYKAEDIKLKRTVAVKFLPLELADDSEAGERFLREAQAAAALSHPHICTIHEINEEEEQPFIVMEYVEGQSLNQKIKQGPLEQTAALDIAIQVAEGLEEAHKKGIIHRDIKPGNIMLTTKGQAKVMDFGLAKVLGESLITKEAKTMGTVAYMSPEQAQGKVVDSRTDIWSLGVVLFEMLTAELPFKGEREASVLYSIVHEEPRSFKGLRPPVPSELQRIITRAMKKGPQSRYRSAAEMLGDLRKYQEALKAEAIGVFSLRTFLKRIRQPRVVVPAAIAIIATALLSVWFFNRKANIRWARNTALPEIRRLLDSASFDFVEAYQLAQEAEKYIPRDPNLIELLSLCSKEISFKTSPPGAHINMKEYKFPESEWHFLGISPMESIRVPQGYFRWRVEKEGYEPVLAVFPTYEFDVENGKLRSKNIALVLDKKDSIPTGMTKVSGGNLGDFFIDVHEVTNEQFREFVRAGGYQKKEYWKHKFIKDGKEMDWEEARAEFVDTTGRPGPATWEGGDYPEGRDDYPVQGVSWYEATAYAEFVGKELPTEEHWRIATDMGSSQNRLGFTSLLLPLSRFGGNGPAPVKSSHGVTTYGAYDMAGNVREWCLNESSKGRIVRGGAWNDIGYMFWMRSQASPFDRSERNGFRCVSYLDRDKIPERLFQPVQYQDARNFYEERPVSDDIFQVYKDQFAYDKTDLEARLEAKDESSEDWIKEKITFNAAYEKERMMAYIFLPKVVSPPYQTVIYFPGSEVVFQSSSENLETTAPFKGMVEFIIKGGRAVLYPIYKGILKRRGDTPSFLHVGNGTRQYSEYLIKIVKDFRRSIDYLETRKDIDLDKLAYYGFSWGGFLGGLIPAVEDRLKVSILNVGGFSNQPNRPERARPEADEINYVTRVKIPTLMLNGKYDLHVFPYETSVKPFYDLLGTPEEHKSLVLCDTDHFIPKSILIKEVLAWLDRYFGPINR